MSLLRSWRKALVLSFLGVGPLLLVVLACYTGQPVPSGGMKTAPPSNKERIRLTYPEGTVILMPGWVLNYPWVEGKVDEVKGPVFSVPVEGPGRLRRFNLEEATLIETYVLSGWKIAGLSTGVSVGVLVAAMLLIAASSCPTVYVLDQGHQIVLGEAYPGAIFRSVQRDDLLRVPLPDGARTVTLRLQNNNNEIQYTDRARLVVVDHAPGATAVATSAGAIVLVRQPRPPSNARDLAGRDVTRLVADSGGGVWQSDLEQGWNAVTREEREGVVASFDAATPSDRVLLIRAENTVWLSVVFNRFFGMMGSSFDRIMTTANGSDGTKVAAWRAREGVDLRVEVMNDGRWTEVANVPTAGMTMMRDIAIPLGRSGVPLQVRLSAGFGFWRIDSVALADRAAGVPEIAAIACRSASSGAGIDETASILATDGSYQVMPRTGDFVDLSFDLPAQSSGARTLFFETSGYYNPLPPPQDRPHLVALKRLQQEPGALARFGRDLYAEYHPLLREPATP